ncbi:MAG: hypothetical protein ACPG4K_00125 [Haloferula sp.]
MNRRFTLIIALFFATFCLSPGTATANVEDQTEERHVAILSVYKSFEAALADAKKISKASKVPFSMEDRIYDKKRGIIFPDDYPDEAFQGGYLARREDKTILPGSDDLVAYLSIEKSDAYDGFKPGFYMVVAGIRETRAEALKQADQFKKWAPAAYVKKTRIYMGCLH